MSLWQKLIIKHSFLWHTMTWLQILKISKGKNNSEAPIITTKLLKQMKKNSASYEHIKILKWHGHHLDKKYIFLGFFMFTMLQQVISNTQPQFLCQSSSYKRELTILNCANKAQVRFLFTLLNANKKIPIIHLKWMWQTLGTVYLCWKRNSR